MASEYLQNKLTEAAADFMIVRNIKQYWFHYPVCRVEKDF